MKILAYLLCVHSLWSALLDSSSDNTVDLARFQPLGDQIVKQTKRIYFPNYPGAYNPSMIQVEQGFLMTFRYHPDFYNHPQCSEIGVVLLNENLDPISEPQLINTRHKRSQTFSQSEDVRLFSYRGRVCLIFNDNIDDIEDAWFAKGLRRDMFIAILSYENGNYSLSTPQKIIYPAEYAFRPVQKNWVPFEWDKKLFLSYSLHNHLVISPNLNTGECHACYHTAAPIEWDFGPLRGGTAAQLVDGEYLAFFHSPKAMKSVASGRALLWHYFAGAYTFAAKPPFEIKKISPFPLVAEGFYVPSSQPKRVIFPGGFVVCSDVIYLAYGKDDCEMWVATIDKKALLDSLRRF